MVPLRIFAFLPVVTLCSGCGYVHLGRLPAAGAAPAVRGGADAFADLRLEHKLLQQELVLVRRESDGLRAALERALAGRPAGELTRRPPEAAPEPVVRSPAPAAPDEVLASRIRRPADLDPRFVATLQEQARLQGENARLQRELERTRSENAALAARLKLTTEPGPGQVAGAQSGSALRPHPAARVEPEQTPAVAQIRATAGLAGEAGGVPPARSAMSALRLAKAPPVDALATAELRAAVPVAQASEAGPE